MKKEDCLHPQYALTPGEYIYVVGGTAPTEHCSLCDAWRTTDTPNPVWRDVSTFADAQEPSETW